jgi:tetratricopeptide (TPR) repeat protein
MFRSTRFRAIAITAMATLWAAACGGSSDGRRTTAAGIAGAPPMVGPTSLDSAPATTAAVSPNVSYAAAESAFDARHYAEAVAMFDAYATRRPDNPWGHYMLGMAAWKAGELDRARGAFEAALDRDPRHVKSLVNLSRVLLDENLAGEALPRVNKAIAIDSGVGDAWRVLGRVQARLGDENAALGAYRTAIVLDSTDSWAMNDMGLLLIQAGRYSDALRPLARAAQLDSGAPAIQNNFGIALERSGHVVAAATAYQSALHADTGYTKAEVSLARVAGRLDAAGVESIDVATLSDGFAQTVDEWRSQGAVGGTPPVPRAAVSGAGSGSKPDSVPAAAAER